MESRRFHGVPFRLTGAIPVDMFPHTEHCELIMLLERGGDSEGGGAGGQQGGVEPGPGSLGPDGGTPVNL